MKKNRQRLYFVLFILAALALSVGLALYALQDNLSYFLSPSKIAALQAQQSPMIAPGHAFRLGGMVKDGSVRNRGDDLSIRFIVTDFEKEILVEYKGILPDLFREGQGVVARGALDDQDVFIATELLAKHDEKYMPPEVARALKDKKKGDK